MLCSKNQRTRSMEKPPKYSVIPAAEISKERKGFVIRNDSFLPILGLSIFGDAPISKKQANILVKDINEIILLDAYLDEGDPKKGYTYSEVSKHPKFKEIREKQEQMSFALSVHRTLWAVQNDPKFRLELEYVIHWDMLYRMSPGPIEKMEQIQASAPAINWLGKHWVDLPANYVSTIEDMEAEEIPFVPRVILDLLKDEIASMSLPEQVAVWYLYELFQRFSITLPILWVNGLISSACLEDSYYVSTSDFSLKEIRRIRKEEGGFVQKRLSYLRQYLKANRAIEKPKLQVGNC